MTDYDNYEAFRKDWFEEDPSRIEEVKREMIREYYATPDMPLEDLLKAMHDLTKRET
ncbi:MAG: hypothetical protein LBQ47_03685 [Endomicrobium sp.]|nr:hypothetical protein [Endomicrobium sp.]